MQRAVLYCRQSDSRGAGEQSLSLESQEAELRAWADREGWQVVGVLREADLKGWQDEDERPEVEQALKMGASGEYEIFAVWKLDRLARSVRLQEYWVWRFAKAGIDVRSKTEPHAVSPMIRQILGAVAEQQTRDIAAHVRRAMTRRAEQGLFNGGAVPWGYVLPEPDGPYVPGPPETVAAVREAFRLATLGYGPVTICYRLMEAGIPSPRGYREWRPQTLDDILHNPVYKGERRWGAAIVPDAHEPLVDAATWAAAQRRQGRAPRRKERGSWLEGLIRHACGAKMYLGKRHRGRAPRFHCMAAVPTPTRPRTCFHAPVSMTQPRVEALAWDAIAAGLSQVLDADDVAARVRREARAAAPSARSARAAAERKLATLHTQRQRASDAYLAGIKDLDWLAHEEKRIAAGVAEAEAELAAFPREPDLDALRRVEQSLRSLGAMIDAVAAEPEAQRMVLAELGHVVLGPSGVRARGGDSGRAWVEPHPEYAPLWPVCGT